MAHQLDFQRGTAAFASFKKPAWHGLGVVSDTPFASVNAAIIAANLDWQVAKLPNTQRIPTGNFDANGNPEFLDLQTGTSFFTYRTDTNFVLGDKLGKVYEVLQNEEALSVCDALVQEGGLVIETAGSLFDGRTVFMCCRVPEPLMVAGVDPVKQYVMICAGHDGNTPIMCFFTDTRVVCNNTLQIAMRGAKQRHSIRHTSSAKGKLEEAIKIMGLLTQNQLLAKSSFDKMVEKKLTNADFWNYLGNVFFTGEEIDKLRSGDRPKDVISTRKENVLNAVIEFASNGIGQQEANPGSMWWAYNAVTGYFSNKKADDPNDRMENLLWGTAAKTMERALVLAESPGDIKPLKSAEMRNDRNNNARMIGGKQWTDIEWSEN